MTRKQLTSDKADVLHVTKASLWMVNTHVAYGHYETWKVDSFVHKSFPTSTRAKFHALKYSDLSLLLQLLLLLPVIVKIQKLMLDFSFCIKKNFLKPRSYGPLLKR